MKNDEIKTAFTELLKQAPKIGFHRAGGGKAAGLNLVEQTQDSLVFQNCDALYHLRGLYDNNGTSLRVILTAQHEDGTHIGSDMLFEMKPPFIYFSGDKDFTFQGREVKNLQDYLRLGGAIWVDSASAGRQTAFDVAVRREMKRVLPDNEFEIVKADHELFNTFLKISICLSESMAHKNRLK